MTARDNIWATKQIFTCQATNHVVISDKKEDQGINKAAITAKGMTNLANITGRDVWDNGKTVEQNGKKALALLELSEHNKCHMDGETPSGRCAKIVFFS